MKEIKLTKGAVALVDDADFEALNQYNWQLSANGYAVRNVYTPSAPGRKWSKGMEYMHHAVFGKAASGLYVDHIDRNKLNNQRNNLREATPSQSSLNTVRPNKTGQRGVYLDNRPNLSKRFYVRIRIGGKYIWGGRFKTFDEAVAAFNVLGQSDNAEFRKIHLNPITP